MGSRVQCRERLQYVWEAGANLDDLVLTREWKEL